MNENATIFNRHHVKLHRNRAAKDFAEVDFLIREGAERLADRLEDTKRSFPIALDLGCHTGQLSQILQGRGGIETLVQCDLSEKMVSQVSGIKLVADEEYLPFAPKSFDLVMSVLNLHWVNDLPGTLIQIRNLLKPDGVALLSFLGGSTLSGLRQAMIAAEIELGIGASPHISPFVDIKDAGALLQCAGFSMPIADCDTVKVEYSNALSLMQDLKNMGESNTLLRRRKTMTTPKLLTEIAHQYQRIAGEDNEFITAAFDIVTLTAMRGSGS